MAGFRCCNSLRVSCPALPMMVPGSQQHLHPLSATEARTPCCGVSGPTALVFLLARRQGCANWVVATSLLLSLASRCKALVRQKEVAECKKGV